MGPQQELLALPGQAQRLLAPAQALAGLQTDGAVHHQRPAAVSDHREMPTAASQQAAGRLLQEGCASACHSVAKALAAVQSAVDCLMRRAATLPSREGQAVECPEAGWLPDGRCCSPGWQKPAARTLVAERWAEQQDLAGSFWTAAPEVRAVLCAGVQGPPSASEGLRVIAWPSHCCWDAEESDWAPTAAAGSAAVGERPQLQALSCWLRRC